MDILCSHSSETEAIPERIAIFFSALRNLGNPMIHVRGPLRDSRIYSIDSSNGGLPICVNSEELAEFLLPNLGEASISHRDALVQKILEKYGCILQGIQESAISKNDGDVTNGYARLLEKIGRLVQEITQTT